MNIATATNKTRVDRLYQLLPIVHRMRDAERGYPLKALLRVISEQVNDVEDDIAQLYEDWFIETAQDWVVPYIGDLVGYRPVAEAGQPAGSPDCEQPRMLVPRCEVANLIRNRRRKGTLALLEQLSNDVGNWPARAVEFFKLLSRTQHINHLYQQRHRIVDLRDLDALDRLDGPFESLAHTVDMRRIDTRRTRGRSNVPSVGVFVWRLKSFSITDAPAFCVEEASPHCFTFSVLGQDAPLFVAPSPEEDPTHIAEEINLPAAIRRKAFDDRKQDFYGEGLSLSVRAEGWAGAPADGPVPVEQIVPADLSGWAHAPPPGFVAIDPVLGRMAFPVNQLPKKAVRVRYRYGFPGEIGGGEYARSLVVPAENATLYRVGEGASYHFHRIGEALAKWRSEKPEHAVIEIASSGVYVEPLRIELGDGQTLQLRAAQRARPVLRLIDWQTDLPDALSVSLGRGSRVSFDGLLVTGRPVRIYGPEEDAGSSDVDPRCLAQVWFRHCTLVPGWAIDCDCNPRRPAEPSLELAGARASVHIIHSIIGSIQVSGDQVKRDDPTALEIANSIIDASDHDRQAIGAPGNGIAHVSLTMRNSTVFGIVDVHSVLLGENSLFTGCVNVARRQIGCMRYCYVPSGCRTPRRYHSQPDGVIAGARASITDPDLLSAEIASEKLRVCPQFTNRRYGSAAYAQLGTNCAPEITRGADDESEMGAWHDLFQPQREANLKTRLAEYTPADKDVGVFFAN
jgi:hypothetical protein